MLCYSWLLHSWGKKTGANMQVIKCKSINSEVLIKSGICFSFFFYGCYLKVDRQIFHALLFNIRNYSLKVINIQWCGAELNIILPRVNSFDIKQKKAWNICFILCHQHQTRSGKIKANKTQQISVTTQVFFVKTELQHI